jgi:glycerophosphoryl diester phosphodiesterase
MRRLLLACSACAAGLVPVADATAANRWISPRPLNIAHQGGENEAPSNTMYAFKRALRVGADMLELDVGVTKDGTVVVIHDTTVNSKTNGRGTVSSKTLREIRKLDAAYWFAPRATDHYSHRLPRRAYRFRGVATGRREPPKGFRASDFRIPTLAEVLRAFPRTPVNVEIKARTRAEAEAEYVRNAEVLAEALRDTKRQNLIVTSFNQAAVDRFHELVPGIDLAPGIDGAAAWLLGGGSPGEGVAAFQVPITFRFGERLLEITTADNVARAHADGYAWQNWFSSDDRDEAATWRRLVGMCVDGIMTNFPTSLERVLARAAVPARCR